ncbi:hypothetical protein [Streptomyces sp. NBC_00448]|uniref:hypothetical protein n=1 Tax=Streptomyces sp. NBC_00448 TaxID=2903652 RepID=UPI002E1C9E0B
MRRGALHVGVWAVATAVAVAMSWFGVRSVLRGTAYDPPRTLPIPAASSGPPPGISSAVHRPKPPPHPTTSRPPASPRPTGDPADVHSYTVAGGQVVLDLGPTSASLVSATPDPNWKMQLWTTQPGWLRVTFTSPSTSTASTLLCTWNGHPPTVQTYKDG